VDHVANLARINLTEEEAESFADQLSDVLEVARALEALDTSRVEPTAHPFPLTNVLREDEVRPCLDRAEVLSAAPEVEQDCFKVPPALGEP
jgi:aspartyl-tRNA(Asn)/glutamyl-tRNA(Gln) amidotransferase subunit C